MKRRLILGKFNPEQPYSDEFKFRKEFIPICALISQLSVVVIANRLFLLDDPVFDSQHRQRDLFLFQNFQTDSGAHLFSGVTSMG